MKYGDGFGFKKSYHLWKCNMKDVMVMMCIQREYMLAPTEQKMYYGKLYFEDVMGHVCY